MGRPDAKTIFTPRSCASISVRPVSYTHLDVYKRQIVKKYTSQRPEYDFIAPGDGFGHSFWVIDKEEDIKAITKAFEAMPALYIADGNHRSAAAALVGAEKAQQNANHQEMCIRDRC